MTIIFIGLHYCIALVFNSFYVYQISDTVQYIISIGQEIMAVYHLRGNHTVTLYEKRGKIRYHLRV